MFKENTVLSCGGKDVEIRAGNLIEHLYRIKKLSKSWKIERHSILNPAISSEVSPWEALENSGGKTTAKVNECPLSQQTNKQHPQRQCKANRSTARKVLMPYLLRSSCVIVLRWMRERCCSSNLNISTVESM